MSDATDSACAPGRHTHADRPNWQPASTIEDYLRNCREGLEAYSERRAAKLFGVPRTTLWRWRMMAEIPEELFDRLISQSDHKLSTKELASVGRALAGNQPSTTIERCPHCAGMIRARKNWQTTTETIVNEWLTEQA